MGHLQQPLQKRGERGENLLQRKKTDTKGGGRSTTTLKVAHGKGEEKDTSTPFAKVKRKRSQKAGHSPLASGREEGGKKKSTKRGERERRQELYLYLRHRGGREGEVVPYLPVLSNGGGRE